MKEFAIGHTMLPEAGSELQRSILRVLAYFDVFSFPLTAAEILENCDIKMNDATALRRELDFLHAQGSIKRKGIYYYLTHEEGVAKRKASGSLYLFYLKQAYRYSRTIARFPFVKGVCISGSLAKGSVEPDADVDYFIITSPGRLWICRTLLTLYKKTFLLNSRKYFCINYFVDTKNLQIPDRNIFTATEITFLIPTYNHSAYKAFMTENDWIKTYYPNRRLKTPENVRKPSESFPKKTLEFLLGGNWGDLLEKFCMKITIAYRKRKFGHLNESDFRHRLRATKGVSKHHPNSFQNKVILAYEKNINTILSRLEWRSVV